MRSVWFGGSNTAPSTSASAFNSPVASFFAAAWTATIAFRNSPISEDVAITKLTVWSDTAVATGSYTFAVDDNGTATAAAVTLTGGATSATFTGSVAIGRDHLIALRSTPTGTPTTLTNLYWVIEYDTAGAFFVMLGGVGANLLNSVTRFTIPVGFCTVAPNAVAANRSVLAPTGGTVTRLSVVTTGTPSPGSYALSLRANDTTDLLTATVGSAVTAAQATGSAAITAGDSLTVESVPIAFPTQRGAEWSATVYPTGGVGTWCGYGGDNTTGLPADNTTRFDQPLGVGVITLSTTEGARHLALPGYQLRSLYVAIATAPGGTATRTFTMRDNYADTALTATIPSGATTANDTAHTITTSNPPGWVSLEFSATNTPTLAATCAVGFVIDVPLPPSVPTSPTGAGGSGPTAAAAASTTVTVTANPTGADAAGPFTITAGAGVATTSPTAADGAGRIVSLSGTTTVTSSPTGADASGGSTLATATVLVSALPSAADANAGVVALSGTATATVSPTMADGSGAAVLLSGTASATSLPSAADGAGYTVTISAAATLTSLAGQSAAAGGLVALTAAGTMATQPSSARGAGASVGYLDTVTVTAGRTRGASGVVVVGLAELPRAGRALARAGAVSVTFYVPPVIRGSMRPVTRTAATMSPITTDGVS